jgi:hypothetical protein
MNVAGKMALALLDESPERAVLKPYEQCGDYIDWSDLGKSIFDRPKPLAEALVKANCPYLKVGEHKAAPMIYMQNNGQVAFG